MSTAKIFSYDGAENRLQASRNGLSTLYVYDIKGNLIAEADSNSVTNSLKMMFSKVKVSQRT